MVSFSRSKSASHFIRPRHPGISGVVPFDLAGLPATVEAVAEIAAQVFALGVLDFIQALWEIDILRLERVFQHHTGETATQETRIGTAR